MGLSDLFIDVTSLPEDGYGFFQLCFLGACYAYILCYASNMISDGSELLLLLPTIAGLVGPVVLPVLGAVPDGAIVLFSGVGPDAQNQLTIGIGALAGSTIMLLTAPWFLSIIGGRVDVVNGEANYSKPKLKDPDNLDWFGSGVNVSEGVNTGGLLMAVTSLSYLVVQIPALYFGSYTQEEVGMLEAPYALVSMCMCGFFFVAYLYYQYLVSDEDLHATKRLEQIVEKIQRGEISLRGVVLGELAAHPITGENTELLKNKVYKDMEKIIKPFFKKYDKDGNGTLSMFELSGVFRDLGESPGPGNLKVIFDAFDIDKNGSIEYSEFVQGITSYISEANVSALRQGRQLSIANAGDIEMLIKKGGDDDEAEEEDNFPDDLQNLSPEQQQTAVAFRAAWLLILGTILVVLFSDPMVDVLDELGARTNIPGFYVSFVLAPLASNASEVIASYNYAQKKTSGSMAISLSALQGACCMNNTFVLGIFMVCVYTQALAWQFFAETVSILFSVLFIALMSMKQTHTLVDGLLICLIYPASLVLVYVLEGYGWD